MIQGTNGKFSNGIDFAREQRILDKAQRSLDKNEPEEAEKLASRAVRLGSVHPKIVRIWVQSAWRQDKLNTAQRRADRYLKVHPDDIDLFLIAIRLCSVVNGPRKALSRLDQGIVRFNGARPWVLKLELLQQVGDVRSALDVVRKMRHSWPKLGMVSIAVAQFYYSQGRYHVARKVIDNLLTRQPNHRKARLMRWSLGNASTNILLLSEKLECLRDARNIKDIDALEVLRAVELTTDPRLSLVCQEALQILSDFDGLFSEPNLLTLFQQAERFKCHDVATRALKEILASGPRNVTVARALLRKAITSVDRHQYDAVFYRLLRYIPKAQHASLEADFILWTEGGQAAIHKRQRHTRWRTKQEALKIARILKRAYSCGLTIRYLRFCYRAWPDSPDIRLEYATALVDFGQPNAAITVLSWKFPVAKQVAVASQRARALLELGQSQAAKTELERVHVRKLDNAISSVLLRILISEGKEEAARALVQDVKRRGLHRGVGSDHLVPSLYGNLLSDLALYRAEQAVLPYKEYSEYLAKRYIYAASNVISTVSDWNSVGHDGGRIPWKIVQYWDDSRPPDDVIDIMSSWANVSGAEYVRFNRKSVCNFLRSFFGAEYERAFRKAHNLAEGADFFRLCYLRRFGGVYADADDRLYGSLEDLLPSDAGMVCFREPFGILANNILACRPEHPAITLASELALEALLANDNESTWSKTGPGLLTRSVASYLAANEPNRPEDEVAILPQYLLRRHVQIHISLPYKKTKKHWNSANISKGVDIKPLIV